VSFFHRMRLTQQISAVILLTLVMGVLATVATLKGMGDVGAMLQSMHGDQVHHQLQLKSMTDNYAVLIVDAAHKARDGALSMEDARTGIAKALDESTRQWQAFTSSPLDDEERALVEGNNRAIAAAGQAISDLSAILGREDRAELTRFAATRLYPAIDPVTDYLTKLIAHQSTIAQTSVDEANADLEFHTVTGIGALVATGAVAFFLTWMITRTVTRKLGGDPSEVGIVATRIAGGDFDFPIHVPAGITGSALNALDEMRGKLATAEAVSADAKGQIAAISKSQAVIEFELDGTIRTANENFLAAVGYSLSEIQGKHHRMFIERDFANSSEYSAFWGALGRGEFQAAEYKRIAKGGREIWIQASYNPIFDDRGKPIKVVKYATDITEQVVAKRRLESGVDHLLAVTAAASNGDLTVEVEVKGEDPIGRMGTSIADMLANLRDSMSTIGGHTQALASASEESRRSASRWPPTPRRPRLRRARSRPPRPRSTRTSSPSPPARRR
jgi:PAS domain S-box-containing protein